MTMFLGLHVEKTSPRFPRTLSYSKGVPIAAYPKPQPHGPSGDSLDAQNDASCPTKLAELTYGPPIARTASKFEPDFVKLADKILCFDGVIKEDVDDYENEKYRVQYVKVYYYLENDTIKVVEPRIPNSGLIQGPLMRRDHYCHPSGSRYYSWKDLNIGHDLILNNRTIHLIDCDSFTKEQLTDLGIELNPPEMKSEDPYLKLKESRAPRREILRRFSAERLAMANDGKVLRFYGIWKREKDISRIVLKYFLQDGTLEVSENHPPNSGREIFHQTKPREYVSTEGTKRLTTVIGKQRVLKDRKEATEKLPCYLETRDIDGFEYITPEDLKTGEDIVILGKTFYLAKPDEFTQQYYKNNFGITLPQVEIMKKTKQLVPILIPPHEIGNWEETARDCWNPIGPPKKYVTKMKPKPPEIVDTVLRFLAVMETPRKEDQARRFIISYYMEDDTIKIDEECVANSGFGGGTFLARNRIRKDLGPTRRKTDAVVKGAEPVYYQASDFYVGARIKFHGNVFLLKDADLAVFRFMDNHPEIYKDISGKEQELLAAKLNGRTILQEEEKTKLLSELREAVVSRCGPSILPVPKPLDWGDGLINKDVIEDKIYSANIPIPGELITKLLDTFTHRDKTDAKQVRTLLLEALGHNQEECEIITRTETN